jgi:1-acyl-sn-glycerol-3-phosphate acyltransferase
LSAHGAPVEIAERPVQLRGSPLARALLRLLGWQLVWDGLPARQGVIVVYPHTSNWDFPLGVLAKWAIGLPVTFWGKHSLFALPGFGRWLRWLGGVPVDRAHPGSIVPDMVRRMQAARAADEFLWLALAPEGTRSATTGWRSGFYRVALDAGVPLVLVQFDHGRRRVGMLAALRLGGNADADLAEIARRYAGVRGRRPAQASPIRLLR